MKPNKIFIIRHGQSVGNVDRAHYDAIPDWKIHLTEQGHSQAEEAGKLLSEVTAAGDLGVYVSSFHRTRQTWESMRKNIQENSIKFVKEDPRLREQEWGYLGGTKSTVEEERDAYGTFFYRIPGGESGADVYDRCTGFLDTLYRDFDKADFPPNVLIVTHGYTMRVLLKRWLHWSVEKFHLLKNPDNCKMVCLEKNSTTGKFDLTEPVESHATI